MDLQLLAISDTHLGEDTSLLDFPGGRHRLLDVLRETLGHGARVGELILLGDIPDRTLSSTREIEAQTGALIKALRATLRIERMVYLPGNHDHTLWTDFIRARSGGKHASGSTAPWGEPLCEGGTPRDGGASRQLLRTFFPDPPRDGEWPDFTVANPVYVPRGPGLSRTYVFTHGTHFRREVDLPHLVPELVSALRLDRLADLRIHSDGDVREARSIDELETLVAPFVDSLWPSSGSEPVRPADNLWFLLNLISGKFGRRRSAPSESRLFGFAELAFHPDRFTRLTDAQGGPAHKSLERFQRWFLPHLPDYLDRHRAETGASSDELTFIYGDTHEGGWGELAREKGSPVRVFNTGSWVVHGEQHHPPCHLFAVDEAGEERFFDVSFAGVQSDGQSLLARAGADVENRKARVGLLFRLAECVIDGFAEAG